MTKEHYSRRSTRAIVVSWSLMSLAALPFVGLMTLANYLYSGYGPYASLPVLLVLWLLFFGGCMCVELIGGGTYNRRPLPKDARS